MMGLVLLLGALALFVGLGLWYFRHTLRGPKDWLGAVLGLLVGGVVWGVGAVLMVAVLGWQLVTWVIPIEAPWEYHGRPAQTLFEEAPRRALAPMPHPD